MKSFTKGEYNSRYIQINDFKLSSFLDIHNGMYISIIQQIIINYIIIINYPILSILTLLNKYSHELSQDSYPWKFTTCLDRGDSK